MPLSMLVDNRRPMEANHLVLTWIEMNRLRPMDCNVNLDPGSEKPRELLGLRSFHKEYCLDKMSPKGPGEES